MALEIEGDILASGGLTAGGVNVLGQLADKVSAQQLADGLAAKQAKVVAKFARQQAGFTI